MLLRRSPVVVRLLPDWPLRSVVTQDACGERPLSGAPIVGVQGTPLDKLDRTPSGSQNSNGGYPEHGAGQKRQAKLYGSYDKYRYRR